MCTILTRLTIVVFVSQIGALIRMNRTLPCMNAQGINLFAAGIHLKQKLKKIIDWSIFLLSGRTA